MLLSHFIALALVSSPRFEVSETPYVEPTPRPGMSMVNLSVGRYGSMPIPSGQRRKLKKWKARYDR